MNQVVLLILVKLIHIGISICIGRLLLSCMALFMLGHVLGCLCGILGVLLGSVWGCLRGLPMCHLLCLQQFRKYKISSMKPKIGQSN